MILSTSFRGADKGQQFGVGALASLVSLEAQNKRKI